MKRRDLLALVCGTSVVWPITARPQTKVARIGYLRAFGSPESLVLFDALRHGLRERGYVEGQNIVVEVREAGSGVERFRDLATDLVRLGVDVIIVPNTLAARAARQATTAIPIVVVLMGDPVEDGLVASLARPGGNITGLTFLGPELLPKRLALLKEALPAVSRVAALWHPGAYGERTTRDMMTETEAAARTLGVQLSPVAVRSAADFDGAFSTIADERADALIVFPSPLLFRERRRIVDLATRLQLPSMAFAREFAELGSLIAYGASFSDLFRRAATYVDKILKGARPADLPVEQPTKFELVINLKTAKALDLTVSQLLLARADEVIE